jgi:predicted amidophosphoribosyltransferase
MIEYGSLLSYSPRGESDLEKYSRTIMRRLKNDHFISNPPILMSDFISDIIKRRITTIPFAHFLQTNPILVPIPKSSLTKPGTLWVPHRLANALVQNGFGRTVEERLERVKALPKSATSLPKDRPKAAQHYDSLGIQKMLSEPKEILLVDDVVTRGATILGAANRLKDAFPGAHFRAFAAMRAISDPENFKDIYDPCEGKIELVGKDTSRDP